LRKFARKIYNYVLYFKELVEVYEFYTVVAILGTIIGLVVFAIIRLNPSKRATKAGSDGVEKMYGVYSNQVDDILKLKDNQIKRLNAKINQLEPTEIEESQEKGLGIDELKALAEQYGVKPALLDIPFVKKFIKKNVEGMTIEEIVQLGTQFGFIKGGKLVKRGDNQPDQLTDQAGYF